MSESERIAGATPDTDAGISLARDAAERWMDEAERLAGGGALEAASRALAAAGRMRRLAETLAERAAAREAREAALAVDPVAVLNAELDAIVARIYRKAAADEAAAGSLDVDEACARPECDRD